MSNPAKLELDETDVKILRALQADGRLPNIALADKIALSPSPCSRRVKLLEENGIIEAYRTVINRGAVKLGLTVFIEVRARPHSGETREALVNAILSIPAIVACHMISGTADFLLEAVVSDMEAYDKTVLGDLLTIPEVKDIRSSFAIRTYKANGLLPL